MGWSPGSEYLTRCWLFPSPLRKPNKTNYLIKTFFLLFLTVTKRSSGTLLVDIILVHRYCRYLLMYISCNRYPHLIYPIWLQYFISIWDEHNNTYGACMLDESSIQCTLCFDLKKIP
uniref:Uncharacterized protein n=1 Tax=Cacopsylla melanoneura TaxID=428564 RepID=A0A8D8XGE3_9HEMI